MAVAREPPECYKAVWGIGDMGMKVGVIGTGFLGRGMGCGLADEDFATTIKYFERATGVEIKPKSP